MKTFLLLALTALACAADPLAGMRFLDGKEHRLSEWPGQTVVVVYFCGHCPRARARMTSDIQTLGDLIEQEHLAAQLVCLTPDHEADALKSYVQSACPRIANTALFAHDPINAKKISLNNIWQGSIFANGKERMLPFDNISAEVSPMLRASTSAYRYPIADLPESAKQAWWLIERGRPGALASAIKARAKDPNAKLIVDAVEQVLVKQQEPLLSAPESLDTVEALEALIAQGEGLPALKPASERLKVLMKAPALKDELKARELYLATEDQLQSTKPKEREAGVANRAKIAQKYPDTVYGKRAAAR